MKYKNIMFNIYYVNLSKIYELSMMINNIIPNTIEDKRELTKSFRLSNKFKYKYFNLDGNISANKTDFTKVNFDVKNTKSIFLRNIIEKSDTVDKISDLKNKEIGSILTLNNINLSLVDEEMVRYISMIRKDTLKNMIIEETNNIKVSDISGILEDYSYILEAKNGENTSFFIKIPCEIKNEFENKYSINDIIIGKVSIIGIYKGSIKEDIIKQNTFEYLLKNKNSFDSLICNKNNKIEHSNQQNCVIKNDIDDNLSKKEVLYIDLIAIIQNIKYKEKDKITSKILRFLKNIFYGLKNG